MRLRNILATAAALAGMQAAQAAECTFVRTPWGLRVTNCRLSDLYKLPYDLQLDKYPDYDRVALKLPNLRVADLHDAYIGGSVSVAVDVENNGDYGASSFEVLVIGTVQDPLNGNVGVSMVSMQPVVVQSLAVGASRQVNPGSIALPNRHQDWDVCTTAIIDPPTNTRATGNVTESNESDNRSESCCRVYGPNPDTSRAPC